MSTIILVILFLGVAAVFEGAETSLLSMSDVRLQTLAKQGDSRAATAIALRKNVRTLLGTLLLGQTVCDISAASLAAIVAHRAFGDRGVAIETAVMTIVVLIFVNLIPKSLAANRIESWSLAVAKPVYALTRALGPLVNVIDRFIGLFVKSKGAEAVVTEEEIKTMAMLGAKAGTVEHGEQELIERVFLFNDITAADVMTPREDIEYLDGRKPLADALPVMNRTKFSRFPVHDGDEGGAVGILHIKDVLEAVAEQPDSLRTLHIKDVAATPMFVPETRRIDDIFRDFQRQRAHMAVVINEFGSVTGIVTVDDLLTELVGEIADESDVDEHVIKRIDRQTVVVHGDAEIRAINRFMNTRIPGPANKTISRVILEKVGDVPPAGQTVAIEGGIAAVVEHVANLRIQRVRLRKSHVEPQAGV